MTQAGEELHCIHPWKSIYSELDLSMWPDGGEGQQHPGLYLQECYQ